MLALNLQNTQGKIVEKIVTDKNGFQFRIVFAVAFVGGHIKGRILSVQPIGDHSETFFTQENHFCLPTIFKKEGVITRVISNFVSEIFPTSELSFLINQPIRGPSL